MFPTTARVQLHKTKLKAWLQGRCVYLEGIVNQHDGIVSLLERRIAMLEHMLQQERSRAYSMGEASTSLQGSGAAEDALVSHPISQVSTPSKLYLYTECILALSKPKTRVAVQNRSIAAIPVASASQARGVFFILANILYLKYIDCLEPFSSNL